MTPRRRSPLRRPLGPSAAALMVALVQLVLAATSDAAIHVQGGDKHTCAVSSAHGATCWGFNATGQLGDGTTTSRTTPASVVGLSAEAGTMAGGRGHTCAVTTGGGVRCWGRNDSGQLGDNTTTNRTTPVTPNGLSSGIAGIAAGDGHTCARTTVGAVKCWGANGVGQLGDGTNDGRLTAVDVGGFAGGALVIAAAGDHTCIATSAGTAWCWGRNQFGQLGDGTFTDRNVPVLVSGLSGVVGIATGYNHTCAVLSGGAVKCWGANFDGQLGDGTTSVRATPVDVTGMSSGAAALAAGSDHTCALLTSGGFKCWGRNSSGQLGDGTTTNRHTPVDVAGVGSGFAVATGDSHSCALISPGVVKCWGRNAEGQLGDGTTTGSAVPVRAIECGNGLAETGEACDDGNLGNGDCCSATCQLESSATVCRPSTGECDLPESCSGTSPTCPGDAHQAAGTDCTADGSPCSLDVCDGAGSCTHPAGNAGTPCRASADDCDVGETCDGSSPTCPADALRPSSHVCRAAAGDCDLAETCSGLDVACPADALAAAGTACPDDGEACTNDACDGFGACTHDALPDSDGDAVCDAQDPCTNVGGLRTLVTPPRAKLAVAKINTETTPGNDKLTLSGTFELPAGVAFGDLDPRANGARVVVESSQGTLLDVQLPPGAYAGSQTRGWKTNARGTVWQYLDKTGAPLSGIYDLKATDRSSGVAGGRVALSVKGKNATYPATPVSLPLEAVVVLGNQSDAVAGKCGESAFGVSGCLFNTRGNTLSCVR